MIPVQHQRAADIAEELRQIYADRLVVAQQQGPQGGRGGFLPMLMRGMGGGFGGGGFGGRGQGGQGGQGSQNRRDAANRVAIGVDARTNTLIISATDPLFNEIKQLVQEMDVAAASENETVRVVTLHRASAAAVEQALAAYAGNAVQANPSQAKSQPANGNTNSSSPPWWASRGVGGQPFGQPSMGNGGGQGNFSPFQGFGGRRSRFGGQGPGGQ